MDKKIIKFILRGLAVWGSVLFFAWNQIFSAQSNNSFQESDSLIKVDRLGNGTVLIRLGYDAITAIASQKGIVVIDAGISTGLTAKYRKIIENEFHHNSIAYLINTHGHPDHTGGNSIFADAVIIGHKNCLYEISDQWKDPEKIKSSLNKIVNDYDKELSALTPGTREWIEAFCQRTRYRSAYNDALNNIPVTKPNLTFDDFLDVDMGDVKFEIIYFGKAHSGSDIIIHIPQKKILMVGDLFSRYGRPGIPDINKQYAERWIKVTGWIELRWSDIEIVINGHGQILSKEDLRSFILKVKDLKKPV